MSVTVSGRSGLTNAYTSVLSATGSLLISGASRCEDISEVLLGSVLRGGLQQPLDELWVVVGLHACSVENGHLAVLGVAHEGGHRMGRHPRGLLGLDGLLLARLG